MTRSWGALTVTLTAALLLSGCGGSPAPIPPTLTPSGPSVAAPPAKPIDAYPRRISIPSINVDAAVVGIGLDNNQYELTPLDANPKTVGWYIHSPLPGAAGPATFLSHVNYNEVPGAFAHLADVKVGDKITVTRSGGAPLVFTTTKVLTWKKSEFSQLHPFEQSLDAQLRLATCGGNYDKAHRNYLSNVWVYAALDK